MRGVDRRSERRQDDDVFGDRAATAHWRSSQCTLEGKEEERGTEEEADEAPVERHRVDERAGEGRMLGRAPPPPREIVDRTLARYAELFTRLTGQAPPSI